ncbi:MAG: GYF domain-containing protein, partial [Polyangiaceae bacterium]
MSGRDEWRWTDEEGVQRLVRTEELRAALASNVLPPTTLVWREGMKEWVTAESLPEFAAAAAGARPRPPHASSATGDRATPTDVMRVATGAAQEGARARIQTLVGISSVPDPDQANVPPLPIIVPGGTGTEPRSVITQMPRFSPDLIASARTSIPRAPRVPSADAPAAERTPTGSHSAVRKPGTSDIDGLWAGRSEPPGGHGPSSGATSAATSAARASAGATSAAGASASATSPAGASAGAPAGASAGGAPSGKSGAPDKDKEITPFAAVADDPTDRAEDKSPAAPAATAKEAAAARAPAASEDDAPTEKRTTTDVMPAARRPASQRPPPLHRPPADSIELDDVLLADAVERSVTAPSTGAGLSAGPARRAPPPPPVPRASRAAQGGPSSPTRSPSARPPPPAAQDGPASVGAPPRRRVRRVGSPPLRERVHAAPPVRPPLKPTATPASATPLPTTATPPGWKSETVKLGSVSSKDAPAVAPGASGATTGKPPAAEKRSTTDTAVRTLRGAGRPGTGRLGDLLFPDSGDNRGSVEPPLVGKLQQPASSVASSATSVPASGSAQPADAATRTGAAAGAQTANMPAMVDPASPSWGPSKAATTKDEARPPSTGASPGGASPGATSPGGASPGATSPGGASAAATRGASPAATPPSKPELGAPATGRPEAARAQPSDPPQRPSGEHDDVVRA